MNDKEFSKPTLRLNLLLRGRSAQLIRDLKAQGLAVSNREVIEMALLALDEKLTDLALKRARIAVLSSQATGEPM